MKRPRYTVPTVYLSAVFQRELNSHEYEELSPHYHPDLIDTEDERFYRHHGIDSLQGLQR